MILYTRETPLDDAEGYSYREARAGDGGTALVAICLLAVFILAGLLLAVVGRVVEAGGVWRWTWPF